MKGLVVGWADEDQRESKNKLSEDADMWGSVKECIRNPIELINLQNACGKHGEYPEHIEEETWWHVIVF